jgi:hypothetical protein
MARPHHDDVRVGAIGVLNAAELIVVECSEVFREVADGTALDPQRAENLAARCGAVLRQIVDIRNTLRLSADSSGVH